MEQQKYLDILNEASVLWISVCSNAHVPDVARVAGLAPVQSLSKVSFFLSEAFGNSILRNLKIAQNISLLSVNMHTFESYQFKGIYQSSRVCTRDEETLQRNHLENFLEILRNIGIAQVEREKILHLYFQQPSNAVTFRVSEIFLQTPRKGAGALLLKLENNEASYNH